MAISEIEALYEYSLLQMVSESYLEDPNRLQDVRYLEFSLKKGTNRTGYSHSDDSSLGKEGLNQGWPGFTRMTDAQISEFLAKFQVVHQWSDNPSTGDASGSRPLPDMDHDAGEILNGDALLANTGFSATLTRRLGTDEYTLSFRSTESRPWESGGDKERDMVATDALSVAGVGFAMAQLDAMEKYYQWLKDNQLLPVGSILNVTGYSLGGHLATVFTEIHKNDSDIQFGQTVTFNGAGRGNWDASVGTEGDFITYFRSVLYDPSCAGIILADCATDRVLRAAAWLLANTFAALGVDTTSVSPGSAAASIEAVQSSAQAMAGSAFDSKSIYQDIRYAWAMVATILTFDLAPDLPLDDEVTLADDHITQVVGFENLLNVNMTASSQVNGPECKVAIESQPLLDKGGGFLFMPGDFGFGHSIDLITDSLALQRSVSLLDDSFTLDDFVEIIPSVSRRTTDNVIGTDYEADALENVLDSLRRIIIGPEVDPTAFHEGAGGFGDWDSRNGYHNNIVALTESQPFKDIAGQVHFSVADPLQGMRARRDFSSFLGLLTLSPVTIRSVLGSESVVEEALAPGWSEVHGVWASDLASGKAENFSDAWIQDRSGMLAGLVQINAENSWDDLVVNFSHPETIRYADLDTGLDVTILGSRFAPPAQNVVFDRAWTIEPLKGGDGVDRLYAGVGGGELHGGAGDDVLQGLMRSDSLFGDEGRDILCGGGGNDHLTGGADADRLEGGGGSDEYLFISGDGVDTLFDSDGSGTILIDGKPLSDGRQVSTTAWVSLDDRFRYVLITGRDGSPTLQVFPVGGNRGPDVTMLFIEHFASGSLGLMLENAPTAEPGDAGLILGDVAPAWLTGYDDLNQPYQALQFDDLGNIIGSPGGQPRPDMLIGSQSADRIYGGEGNDTLLGRDGNDQLSGEHGSDFISAGLGQDSIDGGEGDDILYGDADPWSFESRASLLPVPESVTPPVPGATFVDSGILWARFSAEAGSVPVSNANPDAISPVLQQLSPSRFGRISLLAYPRHAFGQSAGGSDVLVGGDGDDIAFGEAGNDLLQGDAGADDLYGGSGDDFLDGGLDNDLLLGDDLTFAAFRWSELDFAGLYRSTPSDETYVQEIGNDLLRGGEGDDYLFGMAGADALFGDAGNDFLVGDFFEVVSIPVLRLNEAGSEFIEDASDHFAEAVAYHGNDFLDGGDGDDYLVGLAGDDQLFGGDGNDVLSADGNPDEVWGRYGNDTLDGGNGNDLLFGSGGEDELVGGAGDDVLWGDEYAGSDGIAVSAWGGAPMAGEGSTGLLAQDLHGRDRLEGGDGSDTLIGGGRDDRLDGGSGSDLLFGDGVGVSLEGDDALFGGDGDDELQGNGGNDLLMGESGADHLFGQEGDDQLSGGADDDGMAGGEGKDTLAGDDGNDTLFGGDGDDRLEGGAGDDKLSGDEGNDFLKGGSGVDYLGGGVGNDRFALAAGDSFAGGDLLEVIDAGEGSNFLELEGVSLDSVLLHSVEGTDDLILEYSESDRVYVRHARIGAISSYVVAGVEYAWDSFLGSHLLDPILSPTPQNGAFVVSGMGDDQIALGADAMARGGGGDDTITLYGPRSVLLYDAWDGMDRIKAAYSSPLAGDAASVRFGEGISIDDLRLVLLNSGGTGGAAWLDIVVGDNRENALRVDVNRYDILGSPVVGIFEFADGSSMSFAEFAALKGIEVEGSSATDTLDGSNINDRLAGADGSDTLSGLKGGDWLDGGRGDDLLQGGENGDVYFYRPAEGDDWICDMSAGSVGADTLIFDAGISPSNIMFGKSGHNLVVRIFEMPGSLVIEGQVDVPDMRIENFLFPDGTQWSADEVLARAIDGPLPVYLTGTDLNDYLKGGVGDDHLIGLGGNDSLDGLEGGDVLEGGAGRDTLAGNGGDDVLDGGDDVDWLSGGLGDDLLQGGGGMDTLKGDEGGDSLFGGEGDDVLWGGDGDDRLEGQVGNDDLHGGAGVDVLAGGEGDDGLMGDDGDDLLAGDAGDDYLSGGVGDDRMLGGDGADTIYASDGNDYLEGGAGNDYMFGGAGDDVVVSGDGNDSLFGEDGNDSLRAESGYAYLYGGSGNDDMNGGIGNDVLDGEAGNDLIFGNGGNDRMWDGAGDDVLHGGEGDDELTVGVGTTQAFGDEGNDRFYLNLTAFDAGLDTLAGGTGDDSYYFQNPLAGSPVSIVEEAGGGVDSVYSYGDFTLPEFVENLTLTGYDPSLAFNGWGNAQDNVLRGDVGRNQLMGGAGNDSYFVGVGDSVVERAGEGEDTIYADCDWSLSGEVENLVLMGAARKATGSATSNALTGNAQDNVLDGGGGMDWFKGGRGDDLYILDLTGEVVIELADEGIDTVQSTATVSMLAANVENVVLVGKKAINATGNELDNVLTGNAAVNVLSGGRGNDIYDVGSRDSVVEAAGEGTDTVRSSQSWQLGANLENLILVGAGKISGTGNELDNCLTGNSAANVLKGGKGNDTYVVGAGDTVSEATGEGDDTVQSSISWILSANVENLLLTGDASAGGTGNALANHLRGNSGGNTLTGGAGDDSYLFGRGGGSDLIVENDATVGNLDRLVFDAGVAYDQLWLRKDASNLVVSIIGSTDQVVISDWYAGSSRHVERIEVADGHWLADGQVDALVQAMSQMQAPTAGQSQLSADQWQQLESVFAASWQAA